MRSIPSPVNLVSSLAALLLVALFVLPQNVEAQKKYKTFGRKCTLVSIVDPGEMYSTYELSQDEKKALSSAGLSSAFMDDVLSYYNEGAWPESMSTLDSRLENSEVIKQYKAYKVASFDGKVLIVIPSKGNSSMPGGFVPDPDFYMVINKEGIK